MAAPELTVSADPTPSSVRHRPVQVAEVDLMVGLRQLVAGPGAIRRTGSVVVLVRLHTQPLGLVRLRADATDPAAEWPRDIWADLGPAIASHLEADRWPFARPLEVWNGEAWPARRCLANRLETLDAARSATVVVATRERPVQLAHCLDSLLRLEYPDYDIVVVDNDPVTEDTARLVATRYVPTGRVRYVREGRRGLAAAHNGALGVARGEILAFTDDDVLVDRHWLVELVAPFVVEPHVGAVTGLILPGELETPSQTILDAHGGYGKGFSPRRFDLGPNRPRDRLFPFTAGRMGSGANMAFESAYLRAAGGFDPALGAGTSARGGDDLEAFFRVVVSGRTLAYQPSAIVWHHHRRDLQSVPSQVHAYGVGLGAYLTSAVIRHPKTAVWLIPRVPAALAFVMRRSGPATTTGADRRCLRPAGWPPELVRLERRGLLAGPLAYLKSRKATHSTGRSRPVTAGPRPRSRPPLGPRR